MENLWRENVSLFISVDWEEQRMTVKWFNWFRQWRSRADRVLNLNILKRTEWFDFSPAAKEANDGSNQTGFLLFWSTWPVFGVEPGVQTHMHVLVRGVGSDYSNRLASKPSDSFSWFVKNIWKQWANLETFQMLMCSSVSTPYGRVRSKHHQPLGIALVTICEKIKYS